MTAQLSRERLEALANLQSLECMALPASHAESAEMARMLLAGMDSEPVAYLYSASFERGHVEGELTDAPGCDMPVYAAPPSTVAAPDGMPDAADLEFQIDMLEGFDANSDDKYNTQIICWLKELQRRRAAMLKTGPVTAATVPNGLASSVKCWCHTCRPVTITDMRFVVCPDCGNKRCPRANDHRNACSGSNEPGQVGSEFPAAPVFGNCRENENSSTNNFRENAETSTKRSREHFISLCNRFWNWQEFDQINAGDEEPRLEWNGKEFTHRVTQALWRMYQAAPEQEV